MVACTSPKRGSYIQLTHTAASTLSRDSCPVEAQNPLLESCSQVLPPSPASARCRQASHPVAAHCCQQVAQLVGKVVERAAVDGLAVALLQPAGGQGV
jgi:hypothetical protein